MSSKLEHNMCLKCWMKFYPNRPFSSLRDPKEEVCCYCGVKNKDGIYIQGDFNKAKFCKHNHK